MIPKLTSCEQGLAILRNALKVRERTDRLWERGGIWQMEYNVEKPELIYFGRNNKNK